MFGSQRILNDSMFGIYEQWENRDSTKHMRRLCKQFMSALASSVSQEVPGSISFAIGEGWKVVVLDQTQHEKLLDALTRFSCETIDLSYEPPQQELFDDIS